MSWVFLSDEAPGHHKILGLSDAAFRLWIVGLTYCGQQANDGRFSAHAARIMCGYLASPELGKAAIAELVTARLWHATDAGYAIHDYLDYQQSKDSRAASNKAAAERMRAMRAARHGVTPPVREPLRCNTSVTSAELPTKFALPDPVPSRSRPDPVPVSKEGIPKPAATPPVSETPASLVLTGSVAKPARTRKARKPADPMPGTIILGAYTEAFMGRYKVAPPVDNRTRKHFANIARNAIVGRAETVSEQAAIQEACGVAARYVGHPNAYYAQQSHPPGLLDRDWHKLVTEYRTGRTITATTARDHERTASNPILEFAAEVRAQEEEARRRKAEVINVD